MTRTSLNRKLRLVYVSILLVIGVSLVATFADFIPGLPPALLAAAGKIYQLVSDMALLIATLAAAYLANVFQKRASFVTALEDEWRNIVRTKSALFAFCEKPDPSADDYIIAYCRVSEVIDTMRVVYKNAGETDDLIGLYPYAPLHDMRRALQSIDPRKRTDIGAQERKLAGDAIMQSFFALRENFLEELDLEEPRHPLLIAAGRRLKRPGARNYARKRQNQQRRRQNRDSSQRPDIDTFLWRLYEAENGGGDGQEKSRQSVSPAAVPEASSREAGAGAS